MITPAAMRTQDTVALRENLVEFLAPQTKDHKDAFVGALRNTTGRYDHLLDPRKQEYLVDPLNTIIMRTKPTWERLMGPR